MVGELIGRYRLIRQLGEGGMGMVYEAVREDIGGRAAVKLLRPELASNKDLATRFFNEARAANLIEHAGIVRIFDYGCLPTGAAYLAMEMLEGESLAERVKRLGRLGAAEVMRLGRQTALALSAAHAKKVIHRDLKPANIMVILDAEAPGGERVKILDFGIAKLTEATGAHQTKTGAFLGTPVYMSPEQCRGSGLVDEKTDVYALGVILYQLLAGRPPFVAEGHGELIAMQMLQEPPPLAALVPGTKPALLTLITAMLHKAPAARPTMGQVGSELSQLSRDSAAPPPTSLPASAKTPQTNAAANAKAAAAPPTLPTLGGRNGEVVVRKRSAWRSPALVGAFLGLAGVGAIVVLLKPAKAPPQVTADIAGRANPAEANKPRASAASETAGANTQLVAPVAAEPSGEVTPAPIPEDEHPQARPDKRLRAADKKPGVAKPAPPADAEANLGKAQDSYAQGDYAQAITLAKSVEKWFPARAWRVIGNSACSLKDAKLASDAYKRADAAGRQSMSALCGRNKLAYSGSEFVLQPSSVSVPKEIKDPWADRR